MHVCVSGTGHEGLNRARRFGATTTGFCQQCTHRLGCLDGGAPAVLKRAAQGDNVFMANRFVTSACCGVWQQWPASVAALSEESFAMYGVYTTC
jgi:hypothetical protein